MRFPFSSGDIQRSAAHTCTPNSRARKMEEIAVPHPRSSTRIPGWRSRTSVSHSVSHSTFGPMWLRNTHVGSYAEVRG